MSDLETINGKTYQRVPLELNGVIIKFVLVEVPATPIAPIATESEPIATEEIIVESEIQQTPVEPEVQVAPVEPEVQEAEISEEEAESDEDASESQSQLGFQSDEESVVEAELLASPIVHVKTTETDSPVQFDDDSETRSESSTGSSTLDHSVDMDDLEEFPGLQGKVEFKKAEKDVSHTATAALSAYRFSDDLKVCSPANMNEFYLIAVDGNYVFHWDDLNRFYDEREHNLVFQKTPNSVKRVDRRAVCYKPTYKTLQKVQVRTGPGSKYDACGVIPANEQVFVIQEGLLSCDLKLVVDWMALHLPKQMVCEELLESNAQTFDDYIERAIILAELGEWTDMDGFSEFAFFRALDAGKVGKFAKRAFGYDHEEFMKDFQSATQAMKATAKTEASTLEAFADLTYSEAYREKFVGVAKAANRKVKVMWTENGVENCGWISKKKNNKAVGGKKTKPLITRVMGATAAPQVQVFNISADIPSKISAVDCTFSKDAWHFKEKAKRKVPSRFVNGEDETVHCFPPMSFYNKLAKSEIAKIIGSKRFNISWEGKFKLDRYRGLEKERVVCDDGKTRYRTGYYIPNNCMTITFQRYSDVNAFLNADFDNTRFNGAVAEASSAYANLHPVDASMCPEFAQFEAAIVQSKGKISEEHLALERGIHYVSV